MTKTLLALLVLCSPAFAQTPRAGGPLRDLTSDDLAFFNAGRQRFIEVSSVRGEEPGAAGIGLGPRFNLNSCAACHSYPALGGSTPPLNPSFAVATRFGALNKVPYFLNLHGPIREARFKFKPDGTRDGGVHNIFVITGRDDAESCNIKQPDFGREAKRDNISFRIPTPLFGTGLIEKIPDSTILAYKNSKYWEKWALGIHGHENRNGNDGTITRFGWKAQNKSLEIFAGEAYSVEQGVSNKLFPNKRDETPGCVLNPQPEDHTNSNASTPTGAMSDVEGFTQFMQFLAPPQPAPKTDSIRRGAAHFAQVGCALCHTPSMKTGDVSIAALCKQPVNLYSDLLVHRMGPGLADNIVQGAAGPDEFRTAPLWGVGQRLFLLHDGRTSDLATAIQEHSSVGKHCRRGDTPASEALDGHGGIGCTSEADAVIEKYNALPASGKGDMLNFLKAL